MEKLASCLTRTCRRWNVPILGIVAALVLAICYPGAWAQSGAGSIQGTVTDSTGAVIPDATIQVVQQGTNVTFNTKSNSVGFYQVPSLFAGAYDTTISAPKMKTYKATVELHAGQTVVLNPALTAGSITEQVQVSSNVVELTTTDSGAISATLENGRIDQLPMNSRTLTTLISTVTPGLENQRMNGLMAEATEYVADGITLTDREFGGQQVSQATTPDPDSIEEVHVASIGGSALYSTPAAVVISTKSGTNKLHGGAFETARNNATGVARVRQNPTNYAAPHLVRNEFGFHVGGPIILPKIYHGQDKSFFFFNFERFSQSSASTSLGTVPTTAMKNGDFSNLYNSAGKLQVLYDPATTGNASTNYARTQFNYNGVPNAINPARISPTAKIFNDITPPPSTSDNPLVTTNVYAVNPSLNICPQYVFRLDHIFNENNRIYLRSGGNSQLVSSLRTATVPASIAADGIPAGANNLTLGPYATYTAGIGFTHVFSPTFYSETVVSQEWFGQHVIAGGSPSTNFESKLGLPNNFGEVGMPTYGGNLISPFSGTQYNYGLTQIIQTLEENLTKTITKHQIQFGGRFRREQFGNMTDQTPDTVSFSGLATGLYDPTSGGNYTALSNTGNVNADHFLGAASSFTVNLEPPYIHFHDYEFDAYFQDNYHVTRNLTVNLGLRYENHPAPWVQDGVLSSFDFKNDATVLGAPQADLIAKKYTTQALLDSMTNAGAKLETAAQAGMPAALMRNYPLTFSPRIGFAYLPFNNKYGTVLRAAYGRYIYPAPIRNQLNPAQDNTPFVATYGQNYNSASQSPDGLANYLLRANQPVTTGVNTSNIVNSTGTHSLNPGDIYNFSINPAIPPDYVTEVNATVEQPLPGHSALRVTYLWVHGTNLDQEYAFNYSPSTYAWEMMTGTTAPTGTYAATATNSYDKTTYNAGSIWDNKSGFSNDSALQASYQRLFHKGIAYQINYVWSKPFRVGGNWGRDSSVYTQQVYANSGLGTMSLITGTNAILQPDMGPKRPSNLASWDMWKALNRYENYTVDTAIPKQHITFNGFVALPFGTGKKFLGNSGRWMDELVGGWQIAGTGSIISQDFAVASTNWGQANHIKRYKHNAPITDCRSGVCHVFYEWFNGYLAPAVINAASKGVSGLPSDYAAYLSPINTTAGNNLVSVKLLNGTSTSVAYSPGPKGTNPYAHTVLNGPINYEADLSALKTFKLTERTALRFNADAFNAFNIQGFINPDTTTGIESTLTSYWGGRQLQLSARLIF